MAEDRFLKRLRKRARKGLRGWPIATVAFYGPNLSHATKVAVGIVPSEHAEVAELRDWKADRGDIRSDPDISREILEFIEGHQARSVVITDGRIGVCAISRFPAFPPPFGGQPTADVVGRPEPKGAPATREGTVGEKEDGVGENDQVGRFRG